MLAVDAAERPEVVSPPTRRALAHIPGDDGWPLIGNTLEVLADPKTFFESRAAQYGHVLRADILGEAGVNLLGPEANELVLLDPQRLFSSRLGWGRFMDRVFPRGLMMMDFDEHRLHRRALSVAFKAGPLRAYLAALDAGISAGLAMWAPGQVRVYPALKKLTLELAATAFLGSGMGPAMEDVSKAFIAMVAATVAPVRRPLPGTQLRRGIQGRAEVVGYLSHQIPIRREKGGDDLLSQLSRATTEDGALLSVQAVADHMSFLMMAAHDTLTSSLSAFVWMLAANPDWQSRLRQEIGGLGLRDDEPLSVDHLDLLPLTEMAFKETMRIIPPVPALPRRAVRDFSFMGYSIPAGTAIGINPLFTHHMPTLWPDPDRFDPTRFSNEAQAGRHRFAFVPFGGGAHMCLGLNYAHMQAKSFAVRLLRGFSVSVENGYRPAWKLWPIPQPKDGLRISLARI